MPLFSRRFWRSLIMHDRRVVEASSAYEDAARRFRTSRSCVTNHAQLEFRLEYLEALSALRRAVVELRNFSDRHSAERELR